MRTTGGKRKTSYKLDPEGRSFRLRKKEFMNILPIGKREPLFLFDE